MSLINNGKIITEDLVFHVDFANKQKSYFGEPVTNLLIGYNYGQDGTNQLIGTKSAILVTDPKLKFNGLVTHYHTPGSSLNFYLNTATNINTAVSATTFTYQVCLKCENGSPQGNMSLYMYWPTSDGSVVCTPTDMGNGWYRYHRTRTDTVEHYMALVGLSGITANKRYYVSGSILHNYNHPIDLIDINGSRSNNNCVKDLVSNNYLTSSLTADSYLIPYFNGVDNYVNCGAASAMGIGSTLTGLTVEAWVKPASASTQCILENGTNYLTNTFFLFQETSTIFSFLIKGPNNYNSVYCSIPYQVGQWYHLVGVWKSGNSVEFYLNGKLASGTKLGTVQTNLIDGNTNLLIGSRNASQYFYNGYINNVKIYKRALDSYEISNNFNVLRQRYSL